MLSVEYSSSYGLFFFFFFQPKGICFLFLNKNCSTHKKHFAEAFLMCITTYFCGEMINILCRYPLLSRAM